MKRKRMRVVTVKIDEQTLETIDAIAREREISRSELIRAAIHMMLRGRDDH